MKAVLQVADCGPLESLVGMLRSAGIECYLPSWRTRDLLRRLGCDTVLDPVGLADGLSYDMPEALPMMDPEEFVAADLWFDVKAYRNGPKVWLEYPHLISKTVWYRINGGLPIIHPSGDEVNSPCPILTPNLWYACDPSQPPIEGYVGAPGANWGGKAYTCWPAFMRASKYASYRENRSRIDSPTLWHSPACLIHNVGGWGYGILVDAGIESLVRLYGDGSPAGLLPHKDVGGVLSQAVCMVHLKSNDCPGYALYEAIYCGCPLVVPRRLIRRMKMQDLFVEGESCLCWDSPGDDDHGRGAVDVQSCLTEIESCIRRLHNPELNRTIAANALRRLESLVWRPERDAGSLLEWLQKNGLAP